MAGDQGGESWHIADGREDTFEDATDVIDSHESNSSEAETDHNDQSSEVEALRRLVEEKTRIAAEFKEERETLLKEAAIIKKQLKALVDGDGEAEDDAALDVKILIQCSQLVQNVVDDRSKKESAISDLQHQIDELTSKNQLQENVDAATDRMLGVIDMLVHQQEPLSDCSVTGKIRYLETRLSMLLDHYNWYLYETNQLWQCLMENGIEFNSQDGVGPESVFGTVRAELVALKNKEMQITEGMNKLEAENQRLVEEIDKEKAVVESLNKELQTAKEEADQDKNRYASTKEKLSMAVTKGKALVQQRDSLKQSLAEKSSELETCLAELQERSEADEMIRLELEKYETLVASLQETILHRDASFKDIDAAASQVNASDKVPASSAVEKVKSLASLVVSLLEILSHNETNLQTLEELLSHFDVSGDLKKTDATDRSKWKWIINTVGYLNDVHLEWSKMREMLEGVLPRNDFATENRLNDNLGRLSWLVEERSELHDSLREFDRLKDTLSSYDFPEDAAIETRIQWLKNSAVDAQEEADRLHDALTRTHKAAQDGFEVFTAFVMSELLEMNFVRDVMDDLMVKQEKAIEIAHHSSAEKEEIVRMLLEVSGSSSDDDLRSIPSSSLDLPSFVIACLKKMKDDSAASKDSSTFKTDEIEDFLRLICVQNVDLALFDELLEEDMETRSEISAKLSSATQELCILRDEKVSLERDLLRSDEKSSALKEKLSMAVKKGKGLVQDRENLKSTIDEKNAIIENLKLEMLQLESSLHESLNRLSVLSADSEKLKVLEADHHGIRSEKDQLEKLLVDRSSALQKLIESVDSIDVSPDLVFRDSSEKVAWFADYVQSMNEEICRLRDELEESQKSVLSMEDELSRFRLQVTDLEDEKKRIQEDVEKVREDARMYADELATASAARNVLDNAMKSAENELSVIKKEREEFQILHSNAAAELEEVKLARDSHGGSLAEALRGIKALEESLKQAEANVSLLTVKNNDFAMGKAALEDEFSKLKGEAEASASQIAMANETISSLREALAEASASVSSLENGKRIAELEVLELTSKLDACLKELAAVHGGLEIGDLEIESEEDSLVTIIRSCFEKEYEDLKRVDSVLRSMNNHLAAKFSNFLQDRIPTEDSELMQFPHFVCSSFDSDLGHVENVSVYIKNLVNKFKQERNNVAESFRAFHSFMIEVIEDVSQRAVSTKDAFLLMTEEMDSLQEKLENIRDREEKKDKAIEILESACVSTLNELQIKLEKKAINQPWNPKLAREAMAGNHDGGQHATLAEYLSSSSSNINRLIDAYEQSEREASEAVASLQEKLKEYEEEHKRTVDEKSVLACRMSEVENDFKAFQDRYEEEKRSMAEKLIETETELITARDLLQANEQEIEKNAAAIKDLKPLFAKTRELNLSSSGISEIEGSDVERFRHVIEQFSELQNKVEEQNSIAEELGKTKNSVSEMQIGLQRICDALGTNSNMLESDSSSTQKRISFIEKQIHLLRGEVESLASQRLDHMNELQSCQTLIRDLSAKARFLDHPASKLEKSINPESSATISTSEISEIDNMVVATKGMTSGLARAMRKGSSDHLVLNIDSESASSMNNEEDDDKGHVFKSLNTTGLIPKQGKVWADKVDGFWVSGGRMLMNRPKARLGLIAYCLLVHMWVLLTIL